MASNPRNELLAQIRDLLAEIAVNEARMMAILEAATGIQSQAVATDKGLRVNLRRAPAQSEGPLIIRPV